MMRDKEGERVREVVGTEMTLAYGLLRSISKNKEEKALLVWL
jgi:hypothetical protein